MLTVETLLKWMQAYTQTIDENKEMLSQLDTEIGDGDHGNNMARGMAAVSEGLATPPADLTAGLKSIAMSLISKVGGASGPLYGTAFLEMAKASANTTDLATLIQAASDGIAKRGGAAVGDKTMLDVWVPVAAALKQGQLTQQVIDDAVEATKPMQATKGRASYLGDRSIGHLDPGAVSSGELFTTLLAVTK